MSVPEPTEPKEKCRQDDFIGGAKEFYGRKSNVRVTFVSVLAGSYFHSLRATNVASTKIGCPPTTLAPSLFPSGPTTTSALTVPASFIFRAISNNRVIVHNESRSSGTG